MEDRSLYIDMEGGMARVRNNKNLYIRMLGMFLKGTEYDDLLEQLANGVLDQAANTCHAIKGISGNLSLTQLFHCSDELTENLRKSIADEAEIENFKKVYLATKAHVEALVAEG